MSVWSVPVNFTISASDGSSPANTESSDLLLASALEGEQLIPEKPALVSDSVDRRSETSLADDAASGVNAIAPESVTRFRGMTIRRRWSRSSSRLRFRVSPGSDFFHRNGCGPSMTRERFLDDPAAIYAALKPAWKSFREQANDYVNQAIQQVELWRESEDLILPVHPFSQFIDTTRADGIGATESRFRP